MTTAERAAQVVAANKGATWADMIRQKDIWAHVRVPKGDKS